MEPIATTIRNQCSFLTTRIKSIALQAHQNLNFGSLINARIPRSVTIAGDQWIENRNAPCMHQTAGYFERWLRISLWACAVEVFMASCSPFHYAETLCKSSNKLCSSRGAILLEFTLTTPLLLFFLFILVEFGRQASNFVWAINSAYSSVILGADESDRIRGVSDMKNRFGALMATQHHSLTLEGRLGIQPSYVETGASNAVRMNFQGDLVPLLRSFGLGVNVSIAGPILAAPASPIDANTFANPAVFYDWDGSPCPGPVQCACQVNGRRC